MTKHYCYHATDYYGDRECAPPWAYKPRDKRKEFDNLFLVVCFIALAVAMLAESLIFGVYGLFLP